MVLIRFGVVDTFLPSCPGPRTLDFEAEKDAMQSLQIFITCGESNQYLSFLDINPLKLCSLDLNFEKRGEEQTGHDGEGMERSLQKKLKLKILLLLYYYFFLRYSK
jgi:hypothetical protein